MSHAFQDTVGWDDESCLEQAEMAAGDGECASELYCNFTVVI